jgi:hypothetical protein
MGFNVLRLDYALVGSLNFISWKEGMEEVLEDNGLKEFIDKDAPKPDVVDVANLDSWKKKVAKARRILLEGVRDHIVSSLHGKSKSHTIWKVLTDLFQNSSDHRKWCSKINSGSSRWRRVTPFKNISRSLSNVRMRWGVWE